jgi:hypothetical protein
MVAQFVRMRDLSPPPATPDQIERLRKLRERAIFVTFSDDPHDEDARLRTCLIPGEPLFFGYHSQRHQKATWSLLKRCASALGYRLEDDFPKWESAES